MTDLPNVPQRRRTDRGPGWLRWVRRVYETYGAELQLALGIFLLVVATVVGVIAFQVRGQGNEIQDQRAEATISACEEQNARNRNTIKRLRELSAVAPARGRSAEEIKAGLDGTISLINALAPVRDCEARARRFVQK